MDNFSWSYSYLEASFIYIIDVLLCNPIILNDLFNSYKLVFYKLRIFIFCILIIKFIGIFLTLILDDSE